MSIPAVPSLPMDFFSNKGREDFYLSDDVVDAFNFKYVSSSQFKHIIEDVRRDRMRKKEKKVWSSYIREEDSERSEHEEENSGSREMSKLLTRESMEEVDQELERLKEDALPERNKRTSKSCSVVGKKESGAQSQNEEHSWKGVSQLKDNTVSCADMLLTIPEERKSPTAYERSPISRLECSARTRISHSEGTLRPKSESSNRFRRSISDIEYNCSSDESERYDSDGDDKWNVRAHPAAAHKILAIQRKISLLLDEMALRLGRIPLPDGDCDLRRRQQRVMEFSIRFSRNYLYELGRQIGDMQRHLRAISPNARLKPTKRGVSLHVQAIEQKLTSAHQLLLNALDAYCKHIPSSVLKGQPGKLKEILQVVVELNDICSKINLTKDYYGCGDVEMPPLGKNTQNRCSAILSKLRLSSDNESQHVSHTTQSTPIRGQRNKKRGNRAENSKGLPTRLRMYSADHRLSRTLGNKRPASSYTKERRAFGVARKTPPEQHPSTPQQPNPNPATCKSSNVIVKREKTKIRLPQKEDEISTMMSTLPTDSDTDSSVAVSRYSQPSVLIHKGPTVDKNWSVITSSKHSKLVDTPINDETLIINDTMKRLNRITDQQLSSLVPVIADLMTLVKSQNDVAIRPIPSDSMEALMELLKKYRSSTNPEIPSAEESNIDTGTSHSIKNNENSRRLTKISRETRSRAKNMQLICVPSEENPRGPRNTLDVDARLYGGMTDQTREFPNTTTTATTKDSRMRNLRVAESSVESLLKYRDQYQRFSRSNPMYTSNSQNKPWDVVAWISDKLVDELVVDVTKEFQMDDVIRNLVELEFKEF